jgi:hypothetical protein
MNSKKGMINASTTTSIETEHHQNLRSTSMIDFEDPKTVNEKDFLIQNGNTQLSAAVSPENIAVAVVTFQGRQERSIPAIKATWGRDFPIIEYVSATEEEGLITVHVPENTSYARSSWEEMNALKVLYEKYPQSPWYMKADDDAYVNVHVLTKALAAYDATKDYYLGQPITYTEKENNQVNIQYCAGGVGYLISNSAMKKIYHRLLEPLSSCCSDVQIGKLLTEELPSTSPCTPLQGVMYIANHLSAYMLLQDAASTGKLRFASVPSQDPIQVILKQIVGFHYVDPNAQYMLRLIYQLPHF